MELMDRLRTDLSTSLKAGDRPRARAIRSLMSALSNAEAVPAARRGEATGLYAGDAPRRRLDRAMIQSVIRDEIEERREAIRSHGDPNWIARLEEEIEHIAGYSESA